jgi:dihydroxyacetone kinase-like protein
VGDGDHGVTIARGYQSVADKVSLDETTEPETFFRAVGEVMTKSMGGAIGPIYGILYEEMAKSFAGCLDMDTPLLGLGMNRAVDRIMALCQVKPGDKTVVDAMVPAVNALLHAGELPLQETLLESVRQAEAGRDATTNMMARKGRARFLRERSVGFIDAGASSFVLWLNELYEAVKEGAR